jgi:hypothetical protein
MMKAWEEARKKALNLPSYQAVVGVPEAARYGKERGNENL